MSEHAINDPYAQIAELYDLEHDGFDADIPFYLNSVIAIGDPVLELACGSGRVVAPIAKAGYRVTALDASSPMIERGKQRLGRSAAAKRVTWVTGSMEASATAPGGPFGVVILAINGLTHAVTQKAQLATLSSARRALDPRGQLIVDLFHPTPATLAGMDGSVVHDGRWELPDGRRVDKFSSRRVFAAEQRIETSLWYDITDAHGRLQRISTDFSQRYLHLAELELLLRAAGFPEWQVYGGYDLEPFTDTSERMLIAAEASAS